MQAAVYLLCFATSVACTVLLVRGYRQSQVKLLLWASVCFGALTINNVLLVLDMLIFADIDLRPYRHLSALAAVLVLLYGFIWETDGDA